MNSTAILLSIGVTVLGVSTTLLIHFVLDQAKYVRRKNRVKMCWNHEEERARFLNLSTLSDDEVVEILKHIKTEQLVIALSYAPKELKSALLTPVSERAKSLTCEDIALRRKNDRFNPMEIMENQRELLKIAETVIKRNL